MEFRPGIGSLTARLHENEYVGLPLSLFFDIVIPVEPFEYDGETVNTSFALDSIELPVLDWRNLSGREFRFPINPEPGYIDGSIYLGHVHNPADVTMIRFEHPRGNLWGVAFDVLIDFTFEGPDELGKVFQSCQTDLTFDAVGLDRIFAEARLRGIK